MPRRPRATDISGLCGDANVYYLLSVRYEGSGAVLVFADEGGDVVRAADTGHRPYFLVPASEPVAPGGRIVNVVEEERFDPVTLKTVKVKRVEVETPLDVPPLRRRFQKRWEDDVKYFRTYIADRQLIPGMPYRPGTPPEPESWDHGLENLPSDAVERLMSALGSGEERAEARRLLTLFSTPIPDMPRLAVDIEVEQGGNAVPSPEEPVRRVISIAFAGSDGLRRVYMLGDAPRVEGFEARGFSDEAEMLRAAAGVFARYPILLTYNGDQFDLPYLLARARLLGVDEYRRIFRKTRDGVDLVRGVHVDLYRFFRTPAIQTYVFGGAYTEHGLDAVAAALLGERKIRVTGRIDALPPRALAEYNMRDADLTLKLTTFNHGLVMRLLFLFMRIAKMGMEDVVRSTISVWIKQLMLWEHRRRGWLFPKREDIAAAKGSVTSKSELGKAFKGAIVFEPVPGVHFNVVVLDFASLYPSVIKRYNLSYETVNCPHPECRSNKIPGLPHHVCTKRRGLTSLIVGLLRDIRVYVYKPLKKRSREADAVQAGLKVFINASYGVFGNPGFALFCGPMAEAVTAYGRHSIEQTRRWAEELGLKVLYGDTDSVFLLDPPREALEELQRRSAEQLGIDLDVDKVYRWVAFSERKKNYIGVLADGRVDVKGLMLKKRNTPPLLRAWFDAVAKPILTSIASPGDVEEARRRLREAVEQLLRDIRGRRFPLDAYALTVELSKPLDEYKVNAQHVAAAKMLAGEGVPVGRGSIIRMVHTRRGVKPVELAGLGEVDVGKYAGDAESVLRQAFEPLRVFQAKTATLL